MEQQIFKEHLFYNPVVSELLAASVDLWSLEAFGHLRQYWEHRLRRTKDNWVEYLYPKLCKGATIENTPHT
jgi:hypothetical protein